MLAVLETSDYATIAIIAVLFAAVGAAAASRFRPEDQARLRRLEAKFDLLLRHLGLDYEQTVALGMSEQVKALADGGEKLNAIKVHREQTGLGLKEAKDEVDAYVLRKGP